MARIAYVDHSFHQKTQSTSFLPEVLRRHGHLVDNFWDHGWQGGASVPWNLIQEYDVIIMFQSYCLPEEKYFRRQHPNVIYIPMLDQFGLWQGPLFNLSDFWEPFQGSKVLNFSNAIHCMTMGFGIVSYFARYYQPNMDYPLVPQEGLHGFFWIRRELDLPWKVIRQLIENTQFDSMHLHLATDPGTPAASLPSLEEVKRHGITTSNWFEDKKELSAIVEKANVFFVPRVEEGIGQSFLEAIARGQCVVAPNLGTMNEYILPGINGLLYDLANPKPIDFSRIAAMGNVAKEGARYGRLLWEEQENELVQFLMTPSHELYVNHYQHPPLALEGIKSAKIGCIKKHFHWRNVLRRLCKR